MPKSIVMNSKGCPINHILSKSYGTKKMLNTYEICKRNNLPILVLLHGFLGSSKDWEPHIQTWSKHFHCIAFDLPGHGKSPYSKISPINSFTDIGDWIVHALPQRNFFVLGYSMGGRIALDIAKRYPQRVKKCICISGSPGIENANEAQQRFQRDQVLLKGTKPLCFLQKWYTQPLFQGLAQHKSYNDLIASRLHIDFQEAQQGLSLMSVGKQPNMWPWLRDTKTPNILYLCGKQDKKYYHIGMLLQKSNPNIQVSVFDKCSHMLHFQSPDSFQQTVVEFCKGAKSLL